MMRNLQRLKKVFPDYFNFFPYTYTLPQEFNDL